MQDWDCAVITVVYYTEDPLAVVADGRRWLNGVLSVSRQGKVVLSRRSLMDFIFMERTDVF